MIPEVAHRIEQWLAAQDGWVSAADICAKFGIADERLLRCVGELPGLISEFAIDWPLERIAIVDRLIMTLAVGELMLDDAPPLAVIFDEAVELAKTFSTDGAPSFVNGVLSAMAPRVLERKGDSPDAGNGS